jgi:hypothetical protein
MPLFEFTVDANNRTYKCERFVTGQETFQQTISVKAVGKKSDPIVYDDKSTASTSVMQLNARLIAHQIVKGSAG